MIFLLSLFSVLPCAIGQLKLVDLSYIPFEKGPPNAGYIRAYISTSAVSRPGDSTWYAICATTSSESRIPLSYAACSRFGYNVGRVHETSRNEQIPCAHFSCPSQDSPSAVDCAISVDHQWAQSILYVVCYHSSIFPAQPPPNAEFRASLNCDFEGGDSCGWEMYSAKVTPAGTHYQYDNTLRTATGHVLTSNCQANPSWNAIAWNPSPWTEAVILSPLLDQCLGYSQYCFVMSVRAPLSPFKSPTMNMSTVDSNGRENWASSWRADTDADWSVVQTKLTASPPFRLKIRFSCSEYNQAPVLFLDDFLLVTGECPSYKNPYCYNNGKELESNQRDKYCSCPRSATLGRRCELTACKNNGVPHKTEGILVALLSIIHCFFASIERRKN